MRDRVRWGVFGGGGGFVMEYAVGDKGRDKVYRGVC